MENKRYPAPDDFRVPQQGAFYVLDEDFFSYTKGSIFSINYPDGTGGFTFACYKKYNKDTPAKTFGTDSFRIPRLNQLKATKLKTVYNNLSEEQLAQTKGN